MIIALKDAKKVYSSDVIFENLNMEIKNNEKIGLVGRNGSGKTTIFKILAKIETLDEGQLFIRKDVRVGYLAQIPAFSGTVLQFLQSSFQELHES